MREYAVCGCPLCCPPTQMPTRSEQETLAFCGGFHKADARTRTGDPFITSEVLYQLSYVGGGRILLAFQPSPSEGDAHPRRFQLRVLLPDL
jgi:hypothetical protein